MKITRCNYMPSINKAYRVYGVLCLTVSATVINGCGPAPDVVPVSGQVLIDGQPLAHGTVRLIPVGHRASVGELSPDGRFTLSCFELGDGAYRGRHKVAIKGIQVVNESTVKWHAPKKYADVETSALEIEITDPRDDLVFLLTWDGGKAFVEK